MTPHGQHVASTLRLRAELFYLRKTVMESLIRNEQVRDAATEAVGDGPGEFARKIRDQTAKIGDDIDAIITTIDAVNETCGEYLARIGDQV